MTKTVSIVVLGLLALTGAAMADQAVVVDGNLRTPAGDVPLSQTTGGIPVPDTGLPVSDLVTQGNDALGPDGPAEVKEQDDGMRPNVRCAAIRDLNPEGALDPVCTEEPEIGWIDTDIAAIGPNGITVKQWVEVDSGQAFAFLPEELQDQLPEEHRQALEDANEQVNARAAASMVADDALNPNGLRPRFFGGTEDMLKRTPLKGIVAPQGPLTGMLGEGAEEAYLGEGVEEFFAASAPGLSTGGGATSTGGPEEQSALSGPAGGDLSALAVAAVVVGGAILAPMALYHRIRSNNALNNKTRQMVFDAVVRTPGIGVNDAAKAANCSYSTAAYHLERLVEERLLIVSEDGRRARYFKNGGAFSQAEREFVPILQSQECMNVLQVIVENPWCYRAEVAQRLGVSGPTVNWHLKKLMNVGVVKEMREGRVSYLYADKKQLTGIGANLVGKLPEDLVGRLRFENRPAAEFVEPAASLPETTVPEVGLGEYDGIELAPLPEQARA